MKRFVSVGECMIEMSGGDAGDYRLGYAGDTLNTAWYARARLPDDWSVDYVTALGDDLYSQQMVEFFAANGIGTSHIQKLEGRRPGLYLIHQAEGDRHFTYWRGQSAAKQMADTPAALNEALAGADIAYFSGISLAILNARGRGRLMKAIHLARQGGARVAFDPNERPLLWTSPRVMGSTINAAAIIADIVLPTFPDEAALFGDASPEAVAQRYLSWGAEEVVVKNGAEPAYVAARESSGWVAPRPGAKSLDPTGGRRQFQRRLSGSAGAGRLAARGRGGGACDGRHRHRPSRRAGAARPSRPLEPTRRGGTIGLFLGRRNAPQRCVTARKAAEAFDHLGVLLRIFEIVGSSERHVKPHRFLLHHRRLRVHERQQHEHALLRRQEVDMAAADRLLRQSKRHRVAGEGPRLAAEQLPRELVEDDDFREAALRRAAPVPGLAAGDLRVGCAEAVGDRGIELRPAGEPVARAMILEPEFQHIRGGLHGGDVNRFGAGVRA